MPSETESFGLAALEAMACELPVISSNAGGIPELNVSGETGYLCEVGDVKTMAEKAIYILANEERLLQFKAAALARAKLFDIHEIVPIYEAFYETVLQKFNQSAAL
jgi:glycosyltransferase involved in cell wall biosynthesis